MQHDDSLKSSDHRPLEDLPGDKKHESGKPHQGEEGDDQIVAAVDVMNADGIKVAAYHEVAHTVYQMGEGIELGEEPDRPGKASIG